MNRAETYIAKLAHLMGRLERISDERLKNPYSKRREATYRQIKNSILGYRDKLETVGSGDVIHTTFVVKDKVANTEKRITSLHVAATKEEVNYLINFTYKRENIEVTIIDQTVTKSGYYESEQNNSKPGAKRRTSSKGGESQEEA